MNEGIGGRDEVFLVLGQFEFNESHARMSCKQKIHIGSVT